MATAVVEKAIVLQIPPQLMGPESEYEKRRLAIKADTDRLVIEAQKIAVVDGPEALEQANNIGRLLQAEGKEVEEFFKPIKQQCDALKKPVLDAEGALKAALDAEKRRLGGIITTFNQEQERIRQQQEREAREAAEAQAREAALNLAVDLEAAGDKEAAEQVLNEPIVAPVVTPVVAAPRMAGQVGKVTYSCIVENVKQLMQAVIDGKAPMQCFTIDQGWLNKKAALDKEGFNLPGCKLGRANSTHFRA